MTTKQCFANGMRTMLLFALTLAMGMATTACSKDNDNKTEVELPDEAGAIAVKTDAQVGQTVQVSFAKADKPEVEGLTEVGREQNEFGLSVTYKTTSNVLKFKGEVSEMVLSDAKLTALRVGSGTKLEKLDCSLNNLRLLDVSKATRLHSLICHNNGLESLDVSQNVRLDTLSCYDNKLGKLDVTHNAKLTSLQCSNNQLKTLNLKNNARLATLECYNNMLTALNLSNNAGIADVKCYRNMLVAENVKLPEHPLLHGNSIQYKYGKADSQGLTRKQAENFTQSGWNLLWYDGKAWSEYKGE